MCRITARRRERSFETTRSWGFDAEGRLVENLEGSAGSGWQLVWDAEGRLRERVELEDGCATQRRIEQLDEQDEALWDIWEEVGRARSCTVWLRPPLSGSTTLSGRDEGCDRLDVD